jgi:hypothetical protein
MFGIVFIMTNPESQQPQPLRVITTGEMAQAGRMILDGIEVSQTPEDGQLRPFMVLEEALREGGAINLVLDGKDYVLAPKRVVADPLVGRGHRD